MSNWFIVEDKYNIDDHYKNETIYALSNGFIGTRGTFVEGFEGPKSKTIEGNFINGFYESETILYGEKGHAFPDVSQTMLNVPNAKGIEILVDGEACHMFTGSVTNYKRVLDMKSGTVTRSYTWTSNGKVVNVSIEQFVSMTHKHVMGLRLTVEPVANIGHVVVKSFIDGDVINDTPRTNARIDYGPYEKVLHEVERGHMTMKHKTQTTGFELITSVRHNLEGEKFETLHGVGETFEGQHIVLDKVIEYHATTDEVLNQVVLCQQSYDELLVEQRAYFDSFWASADVTISGDESLQLGMRFNMFHLLQATGRDGRTSVGAKGLTGEGYEGHCFWDTEMYAAPFFMYTKPEVAKALLTYRYHTLEQAKARAKEMDCAGALYPWRTINGEEASPYFPAGTAQYHINADIAFAVQKYFDMTQDETFFNEMGAEILIETARFYYSYGDYIPSKNNKFCLNGVTGPDEYTAIVNNNFYTNILAKENLLNAVKAVEIIGNSKLVKELKVTSDEVANWQHAADNMYFAYDEEKQLFPQDDSFFEKAIWDIENTPKEKFPLLDNYHPLMIYKKQVCKQADLILALFLQEHKYDTDMLKRHYDYYEKVTVHESSLSFCIHSILAAHIGYEEQAYDYFMKSARLDLDDLHGNTHAGIHMANLAGTWMCITHGFGGMTMDGEGLSFAPVLPKKWDSFSFVINFRGTTLKVTVSETVEFEKLSGPSIDVKLFGKTVRVGG